MRWPRHLVKQADRGVTLVELMVTIAIMMILALASVPLGRSWIANSHIAEVNEKLIQAFSRARTEALINRHGKIGEVAAYVRYSGNQLEVFDGNNNVVWVSNIYPDTLVTLDEICAGRIELNADGLIVDAGCRAYTVSASGGTSISATLAGG